MKFDLFCRRRPSRHSNMVRKFKDANAPTRPLSAYMLFGQANRSRITKRVGNAVTEVAKAIGAEWGALTDAKKAPFQKKAEAAKAKYQKALAKYKQSAKYQKYLEEKAAFDRKQKVLAVTEPKGKPKRAMSGYMLYTASVRDQLNKKGITGIAVSSEASKMWNALSDAKKAPFQAKASKAMAKYKAAMAKWKSTKAYAAFLEEKKAAQKEMRAEEKAMKRKAAALRRSPRRPSPQGSRSEARA